MLYGDGGVVQEMHGLTTTYLSTPHFLQFPPNATHFPPGTFTTVTPPPQLPRNQQNPCFFLTFLPKICPFFHVASKITHCAPRIWRHLLARIGASNLAELFQCYSHKPKTR